MTTDQSLERGSDNTPENTDRKRRDLPPEIWLEIFSYFDYATLSSSIPLVCRYFHRLLRRTSETSRFKLDKILFRDAPGPEDIRDEVKEHRSFFDSIATEDCGIDIEPTKKDNAKTTQHTVHPALQKRFKFETMPPTSSLYGLGNAVIANCMRDPYPSQTEHENGIGYMFESLLQTSTTTKGPPSVHRIWRENATSPPTRTLTFKLLGNTAFVFWNVHVHVDSKNNVVRGSITLNSKSPTKAISVFDVLIAWLVIRHRHCQFWSARPRRCRVYTEPQPRSWSQLHPKSLTEEDVKSAIWWFLMTNLRLKCSRKGFNTVIWPQVKDMMDEMESLQKMTREVV